MAEVNTPPSQRGVKENVKPDAYDFYLSGRPEMIRDVTAPIDEQFPGSIVYAERFFWLLAHV